MTKNDTVPIPISVVMSAYNAEPWIAQAIESTLAQTYGDFEFLVVNDGSVDRTGEIINSYATTDVRIRPIHHENWGLCKSVNHAVSLASFEWIARMDADDIMLPNRLQRQVQFIRDHTDIGVAAGLAEIIDVEGKVHWRITTDMTTREAFERYRSANKIMPIFQNSVMMRKSVFQKVGGHRSEYWPCDDMDLWNRIADDGTLILIQPEYLVQYRIHGTSISVSATRKQYSMLRWVRHSTACRREGRQEPSYEEFMRYEQAQPFARRAWLVSSTWSEILYKTSSVHYVNGKRLRALIPLLGSLILNPRFCVKRMSSKIATIARSRLLTRSSGIAHK